MVMYGRSKESVMEWECKVTNKCEDLGISHYHAAAGKGWCSGIGGNPPG